MGHLDRMSTTIMKTTGLVLLGLLPYLAASSSAVVREINYQCTGCEPPRDWKKDDDVKFNATVQRDAIAGKIENFHPSVCPKGCDLDDLFDAVETEEYPQAYMPGQPCPACPQTEGQQTALLTPYGQDCVFVPDGNAKWDRDTQFTNLTHNPPIRAIVDRRRLGDHYSGWKPSHDIPRR